MKKSALVFSCLFLFTMNCYAIEKHENGWVFPMDKQPTTTGWNSWKSYTGHVGHDYLQDAGSSVRAIADGVIVDYNDSLSKYGGPNNLDKGGAIALFHETFDGMAFYAVYGHNYIKSGLKKGDFVQAGDIIGYTHSYIGADHIHFGIHPNSIDSNPFRGICYSSDDCGWVDPAVFLEENHPGSPLHRGVEEKSVYGNVSVYWRPANTSCINAHAWCYDGVCSKDYTSDVCYEACDALKNIDTYKYAQQEWQDTFFGNQEEFDNAQSECSAN